MFWLNRRKTDLGTNYSKIGAARAKEKN